MFHKDSGLLLVRGNGSQVRAVSQVISRLEDDTARRGKDSARSRQVSAGQEAEIKKCEVRTRLTEQRVAASQQELAEVEQMVKAGNTSTAELRSRQQELAQARAEFDIAMIDLERARAEAKAGPDAVGGDEISQLRGIVAQLQAEVAALKQALGEQKGGGTR
jgi:chromosome segregation ATPase